MSIQGASPWNEKAFKDELAQIRAGPNKQLEEAKFVGRMVGKLPNGRNVLQVDQPFFQDMITRYEDFSFSQTPFLSKICLWGMCQAMQTLTLNTGSKL